MKIIIIILMFCSLFAEEPIVKILTKSGMLVSGKIQSHNDGWINLQVGNDVQQLTGGIDFSNGIIKISEQDIILIDYGIKTIYENETDSTKKTELSIFLKQIFPIY